MGPVPLDPFVHASMCRSALCLVAFGLAEVLESRKAHNKDIVADLRDIGQALAETLADPQEPPPA